MINPVHRGPSAAKPAVCSDGSAGQQAILDELAVELQRLRDIEVRASRIGHVRPGSNAAAALFVARFAILNVLHAVERAERLGGTLKGERIGDRWELIYTPAPARVVDLAAYRARRAG